MPVITQDETNWGFLLIVVILVAIVSGGALWYTNQEARQQALIKISPKKIEEIPKKIEEIPRIEQISKMPTIAGFHMDHMWNILYGNLMVPSDKYAYARGLLGIRIIDISNPTKPILLENKNLGSGSSFAILNNRVYITDKGVLKIIDISDPLNFQKIDEIQWTTYDKYNFWIPDKEDIYVSEKYAYLIDKDDDRQTVSIIDISGPKAQLINKFKIPLPLQDSCFNIKVFVSDNYLYAVCGDSDEYQFNIIDISNPKNPIKKGAFKDSKFGKVGSIFILGNYAYITVRRSYEDEINALLVINVLDPSAPSVIGEIKIDPPQDSHNPAIFGLNNYIYLAGESTLHIIDVSNPENPIVKFSITDPIFNGIKDIYATERWIYLLASESEKFLILDKKAELTLPEGTRTNPVANFEECLDKRGTLSLKNYPCQCEYENKIFTEETKIQNVKELFQKYTDKEFGFSFYYPKDNEIEIREDTIVIKNGEEQHITIEKKQVKEGNYLFDSYMPAGGDEVLWTSYILYDENQKKCLEYFNDYKGTDIEDIDSWRQVVKEEEKNPGKTEMPPTGHLLKEPDFYTISNLPVFNQKIRHQYYNTLCLYPDKFLDINVFRSDTSLDILDVFTKTITRTDQKVDQKELEKILTEYYCLQKKSY